MNASIPSILSRHAEEASFLWLLRANAVHQPHYSLKDRAKLDGRVDAHLDGLRIAGPDGWKVCEEELKWEEAGEFFTAGVLAFESGDRTRIAKLAELIEAAPLAANGLISALGWVGLTRARPHIDW